jgi:hypothetical protein
VARAAGGQTAPARDHAAGGEALPTADDEPAAEEPIASEANESVGRSLLVLAAAAVATFLASRIGFLLAFSLMIAGLLAFLEREKPTRAIAVAVGTFALTWLVFVNFLRIPLPETLSF